MKWHVDPIRDVPLTRAGLDYVRHRLRELNPATIDLDQDPIMKAAVKVWIEEKADWLNREWIRLAERMIAHGEADEYEAPGPARFERLFWQRVNGYEMSVPYHLEYSPSGPALVLVSAGTTTPVRTKGTTLDPQSHIHEWRATNAVGARHRVEERGSGNSLRRVIVAEIDLDPDGKSHFNKALSGMPAHLHALGIAKVDRHDFPVAFTREQWTIDPHTKMVAGVVPKRLPEPSSDFNSIDFFKGLFSSGQLPLASENDALLYLMAIASPLLRDLLPGQLGIYWLVGPVGSGKDFLAEAISEIWSATGNAKVKFDLTLAGEMELRRSFAMAGSALVARAKEAGKSRAMIDLLIRFAGTDRVAARALYENETTPLFRFTIIADSAEDLPERREISRRTALIQTLPTKNTVSKGAVLRRIKSEAANIISDLKRKIEAYPPEFFLEQSDTDSRPLGPAALAKVLGATLAEVKGGTMEELFDAMVEYVIQPIAIEEGRRQQAKARPNKDSRYEFLLPSYRLSHFAETMSAVLGYRDCFRHFPTGRSIEIALHRENGYGCVATGAQPYLRVQNGGRCWAFRLVRGGKNFVFVPEEQFLGLDQAEKSAKVISIQEAKSTTVVEQTTTPAQPDDTAQDGTEFDPDRLLQSEKDEQ